MRQGGRTGRHSLRCRTVVHTWLAGIQVVAGVYIPEEVGMVQTKVGCCIVIFGWFDRPCREHVGIGGGLYIEGGDARRCWRRAEKPLLVLHPCATPCLSWMKVGELAGVVVDPAFVSFSVEEVEVWDRLEMRVSGF